MRGATVERHLHQESLRAPAPDFDRLAHIYRWMEWFSFGPFLWRCRCAFLNVLKDRHAALVVGDGDGRFTAQLLRENSHITVDAVDASGAMLRELHRRARSNSSRLQIHLSDARAFLPAQRDYDLVVTHFFLDCLSTADVERLAVRLRGHASGDAVWVVSEFAVPAGWYGRVVARPVIRFLYWIFGWLTGLGIRDLPNHRLALTKAGWSFSQGRRWLGGMLVNELWRLNPRSE
jgi:Methyltransferase domain